MDCRAVLFCSSKCHSVSLTLFHSDMNSHVSINRNQNKKEQRLTSICRHRGSSEFVLVLECYNLYQHDNQSFRLARSQVQQRLLAKNTILCRHADKTPQLVSSPQGLTLEQQIIPSSLGLPPCGKSLHFCVHWGFLVFMSVLDSSFTHNPIWVCVWCFVVILQAGKENAEQSLLQLQATHLDVFENGFIVLTQNSLLINSPNHKQIWQDVGLTNDHMRSLKASWVTSTSYPLFLWTIKYLSPALCPFTAQPDFLRTVGHKMYGILSLWSFCLSWFTSLFLTFLSFNNNDRKKICSKQHSLWWNLLKEENMFCGETAFKNLTIPPSFSSHLSLHFPTGGTDSSHSRYVL